METRDPFMPAIGAFSSIAGVMTPGFQASSDLVSTRAGLSKAVDAYLASR